LYFIDRIHVFVLRYRSTVSGTDIEAKRFRNQAFPVTRPYMENDNAILRRPKPSTSHGKNESRLQETVTHLREDIRKVDEPQLRAMFETSAEVLGGLIKAFSDYEKKNEAAWRKSGA
jgi:hypothetical protein